MKNYSKSAELLLRAERVMAGGVSSEFRKYSYPHALFFSHGVGSRIFDVDGNAYVDFSLSQGPLIVGHAHPYVQAEIDNYSSLGQLFAGQHFKEVELAEKICEIIPSAEKIRFCLDGSEAVQTAFRIARAKTGRQKFLRFEGHYHGWMDNVAYGFSASSIAALGDRKDPNFFPWSQGLSENSRHDFFVLPWNDLQLVENLLAVSGKEIAAIIMEPVMCNNGCIMPKNSYLQGIRDLCDQYGIALIFDEVITGFRLSLSGAQGYFNIKPDLSIFAKALGSGHPISAIVGKDEWMEVITQSKVIHAGTMNACNSTVAAALATIQVLENDPNTYHRMYGLGKKLMNGINDIATRYDIPLLIEGPGPVFSTTFSNLKKSYEYRDTLNGDKVMLTEFVNSLQELGVRILSRGLWYISAVHTLADIEEALTGVEKVFRNFKLK
ncbi:MULTISPECIES: aspartate aminotransferase family protein [Sphingobacterium]|uniref:aspartate aminotransferase family protein n=1 Tax=Sphingobacterium TaxID=28453 RepID=UPI00258081E8|nr:MULTISPECIES: aspartate aminotransferase family protein [Sphingobacterium]